MSDQRPPVTGWQRDLVLFIDRQIIKLAQHWLAAFNLLIGVYLLLPILAPVLMASGAPRLGRAIYVLYAPACHQLPQRSFFLYGPQATFTLDELWALGEVDSDNPFVLKQFLGSAQVGFKMALCVRDVALYGGLLTGGLLFALLRKQRKPISLLVYGLCLLPMVIDGGTQLIGLRESNWILRLISGGIAGIATVWLLYPHIENAFDEVRWRAQTQVKKA
ncbi:MAG: DUF2085 domain-containing protein [Anaerolineae bacterium]|nr:DUF2085 domain-containing protein [Anaerolineae bacterium]